MKALLEKLPKPVRFGLFGALGGFLGALLIGELLWFALEPPPPPEAAEPPPQLGLSVSPSVAAYQGGSNEFTLQFESKRLNGAAVRVEFSKVPQGIVLDPVAGAENGTRTGAVRVAESAPTGLHTVTATATATVKGEPVSATSDFQVRVDPLPRAMVDVAFAVDISGSMQWAINGVANGSRQFAAEMAAAKTDVRFALVAYRHYKNGPGYLQTLSFRSGEFTGDSDEFRDQVSRLRAGGGGDPGESSLDGVTDAARLPFRPKATKVVLLISDEPPVIPDGKTASMKDAIDVIRGARIDQLHLVVNKNQLAYFEPLQTGANGQMFDLRTVVGGDGFQRLIPELSKVIAKAADASRPKDLQLSAPPPPPTLPATQGLQSSRSYDSGSRVQLLVAISLWTSAIAAGISLGLAAMQFLSLNRWPSSTAAALGLAGGAVAGVIGGAVGQGLFTLAPSSSVGVLFRVVGWSALGALAGGGLAFVVPNLRKSHGVLGGLLGGLLGAVGYLLVSGLGLGDVAGRLAGAIILGFFIGLMVALVEAAMRRAWLEVRFGSGETITVNLGPEPVKVGGDSRQCAVWARGAAAVALRYWLRDGRVVCDEAGRGERMMANGDRREAGNVVVTVRTSNAAAAAAPVPSRVVDDFDDDDPLPMPAPTRSKAVSAPAPRPSVPPPPPPPSKPIPVPPPRATTPSKPIPPPAPRPVKPASAYTCSECGAGVEKAHGVCPACGGLY